MKLTEINNLKVTGIYLITNTISGYCYVGQAKNIATRIKQHLRAAFCSTEKDYDTPLHKAFRKYGLDNFDLKVLQICDYNQLNNLEQYWVSKYNCFKNGYNQTAGGKQSIRIIKLTEEDVIKIRHLLKAAELSFTQIADQFNVCRDLIYRINEGRAWHDNSCSYPIRQQLKTEKHQFKGYCIAQRDKKTNEILKQFPSREFAAVYLGNTLYGPHISECCNGNRKTAYGFKWTWEKISKEDWLKLFD